MSQQTRKIHHCFRGTYDSLSTIGVMGWAKADTSSAGSPTLTGTTGGGIRFALDSTNEVQNLCLYQNDVLGYSIGELISVEFVVKTVASLDSATSFAFGVASARNDAIDSISEAALFRCIGSNSVVVETDDGTNNNDDVATGVTLGTSWKRFVINFAERNTTVEPPSVSTGRPSNIGFYASNDNGSLRRVASGTRFDMSNYTGGLQLFAQLQKTADTNTDTLDILEVIVEVNQSV